MGCWSNSQENNDRDQRSEIREWGSLPSLMSMFRSWQAIVRTVRQVLIRNLGLIRLKMT